MRELAISALSLSWGLSLYAAKLTLDFFSPESMADNLKRIGDNMQSQTVDAALLVVDPRNWFKEETLKSFESLLVPFAGQKKASGQTEPAPASPAAPGDNTREFSAAPGWGPMPTKKL